MTTNRKARREFLKTLLEGFEDSGVGLAPVKRQQAKVLIDRVSALGSEFDRNVRDAAVTQAYTEGELKGVLELWSVPEPSKTLDERVSNSYYMEYGSDGAANQPIALPQSQKEVVTMKFCSTCQEEFAEKFSFCPVDGTPLNGFVPREDESVTRAPAQDAGVRVVPSTTPTTPTRTSPPVHAAAAAAGAAGALVEKEEFHFTFMDDAGLTERLIEAVKEIAHESE